MNNHSRFSALFAAVAVAGCGQSTPPQQTYDAQGRPLPQQAQSSGDNSLLWGLGGFLLGRSLATPPAPQPQVVHQPSYQPHYQEQQRSFTQPSPAIGSAVQSKPEPAKTAVAPMPTPVPANKPTYSGPTGYSGVNQTAPTYKMDAVTPKPITPPSAPVAAPKPPPPPAPKPSVSYSFKPSPSPAPSYRAPSPSPSPSRRQS